jgi:hypothetical protein
MRLIYTATQAPVLIGDPVTVHGQPATVSYFRKPHKSSSEGKVSIKPADTDTENEFYVSVIGAEWIEREDRQ